MSVQRIGIRKALPILIIGISCILITTIIFGILCSHMIRKRRKMEKIQRENKERQELNPVNMISSPRQTLTKLPVNVTKNNVVNSNQSAAIRSSSTETNQYSSSSLSMICKETPLHPIFKIHPHFPYSFKRIIEL